MNRKKKIKKALIYIRYAFPTVALLLLVISLFIPCGAYSDSKGGVYETMSVAGAMSNSWDTVRHYLFSSASEIDETSRSLGIAVLTVIILSALLFIIAIAFTVYFTYSCFKYIKNPNINDRPRAVFLTVVPCRAVSVLYFLLCLPMASYQRILPILYSRILRNKVELDLSFADPFLVALSLFVILTVLSAVCKDMEISLGMNPFKKNYVHGIFNQEDDEETAETDDEKAGRSSDSEDRSGYDELNKKAREEQIEAIRKLLKNDDEK